MITAIKVPYKFSQQPLLSNITTNLNYLAIHSLWSSAFPDVLNVPWTIKRLLTLRSLTLAIVHIIYTTLHFLSWGTDLWVYLKHTVGRFYLPLENRVAREGSWGRPGQETDIYNILELRVINIGFTNWILKLWLCFSFLPSNAKEGQSGAALSFFLMHYCIIF